jgi:hypothetical protein
MAWVFFGTLVLAAASSLVIGGGWAAVAHFTRPVLFNRPVDNDGPRAYVLLNQPVEQGDPS